VSIVGRHETNQYVAVSRMLGQHRLQFWFGSHWYRVGQLNVHLSGDGEFVGSFCIGLFLYLNLIHNFFSNEFALDVLQSSFCCCKWDYLLQILGSR
jgi:hypothetical protein